MMRTSRPFRWVEASKVRHAIPADAEPQPGDEIISICGLQVVLASPTPRAPYPECADCDRVWRDVEGIPQRATHPAVGRS